MPWKQLKLQFMSATASITVIYISFLLSNKNAWKILHGRLSSLKKEDTTQVIVLFITKKKPILGYFRKLILKTQLVTSALSTCGKAVCRPIQFDQRAIAIAEWEKYKDTSQQYRCIIQRWMERRRDYWHKKIWFLMILTFTLNRNLQNFCNTRDNILVWEASQGFAEF